MNWAEHMLSSLLAIRGARRRSWFLVGLVINCSLIASAQTPGDQQTVPAAPPRSQAQPVQFEQPPVDLKSLPRNIFLDQKNIVTAPFHFTVSEWQWTVPLAFVGAGLLASDTAIEKHVPMNPSTVSHAVTASNAGVAAFAAVGGGMFLWGHFTSNDQERETGLLSGEAAIDALLDTEVLKYASGRERPFTGNDRGQFFQGGSSFPSEHSSVSWAIASVIAHEYPGPLTEFLAYGLAGGVGAARLVGHQHFATDVLVGSAIGWYTGRQVFRSHSHYSNAEIARWGTFRKTEDTDSGHEASNMGSSYVPLDSWIYPAMERLIATGYIQSADLGMRPWTRMECARLLQEANQATQDNSDQGNQPRKIYAALAGEFSDEMAGLAGAENLGVDLDSVYTRATQIVGQPLHDSLNFGQTIVNDYGRPYGQGFNNITGFSAHAVVGPLSFYVRSEYQHAPSISPLSAQAAQIFPGIDAVPPPPATPVPAINQVDLLEGYVGMQLDDWQITFGKQSLWWGADKSGPMLLSTNAEPILMLQLDRVKPFKLPLLGDIRVDYLVGRLGGYHFVFGQNSGLIGSWTSSLSDQPFILGEKVSLKPTPDLELGFSVTALFGGPGVPATLHKLLQAGFSTGNGLPGTPSDPGDRRGGFDLNYRVPGMRDWLSFYADAFTDDEPNPWLAWNKAALTSGLYLSRVPGIQKLDFRVEGVYTDPPGSRTTQHGFFYDNDRFLSGYTNNGNLIGSWIGRQGQGADAWTSYWINPKSKVQFNFRHQKVSKEFLLYGGSLTDFGVSGDYRLTSNFDLSAWVQHERWLFPVIQSNVSRNVTTSVQISFEPQKLFRRSAADSPTQQP